MKKICTLSVLFTSFFLIVGCSNKEDTTKESTHISSTEISSSTTETESSTLESTSQKSTTESTHLAEPVSNTEAAKNTSYQLILDDYTAQLVAKAPALVTEYNSEYPNITNGIDGLAELLNQKIAVLADIVTQGANEMADFMWSTNSEYSEYESWVGKLYEIYNREAEKITEAYFNSVGGEFEMPAEITDYTPADVYNQAPEPVAPESRAPEPQQPVAEYTTVLEGEGLPQIASRAGISLDELLSLNGLDMNNYDLHPGDQLRIK